LTTRPPNWDLGIFCSFLLGHNGRQAAVRIALTLSLTTRSGTDNRGGKRQGAGRPKLSLIFSFINSQMPNRCLRRLNHWIRRHPSAIVLTFDRSVGWSYDKNTRPVAANNNF
jgi:hypothetical protein